MFRWKMKSRVHQKCSWGKWFLGLINLKKKKNHTEADVSCCLRCIYGTWPAQAVVYRYKSHQYFHESEIAALPGSCSVSVKWREQVKFYLEINLAGFLENVSFQNRRFKKKTQ